MLWAQDVAPPPSPADLAWKNAQNLYNRKTWNRAEAAFETFRRQYLNDSRSLDALRLSGVCRRERGDTTGAIRAWSFILQAPSARAEDKPVIMKAAVHLYDAWEGARARLERERLLSRLLSGFASEDTTLRLHEREGVNRFSDGDFAGAARFLSPFADRLGGMARKQYELSIALSSKANPDLRLILDAADECYANDEVEEAVKLYQALLKQKPDRNTASEARTKLGWCHYMNGNWRESEKLWQTVLKEGPPGSEWVGRSRWHMIQLMAGYREKPERAIELCDEQAGEFAGSFKGEQALVTKGWLLWTRKEWGRAIEAFNELATAYPHTLRHEPIRKYIRDCEEGLLAGK